jgi:enoyl-CoA hydratase
LAEVFSPAGAIAAGWLDEIVAPEDVVTRATEKAREFALLDRAAHTHTKLRTRSDAIHAIALAYGNDSEGFRALTGG